jgi:cytochrome c-type biogenesis protein CcmH/NrfF
MAFFSDRYGPRVLLNPPSNGVAGLIWVIPVVVVAASAAGLVLAFGRWRTDRAVSASRRVTDDDRRLVDEAR